MNIPKKEIIDSEGNKIPNLYRDRTGGISVNNPALLNKFLIEQNNQKKILKLEGEIQEIKDMLVKLLNK